MIGKVKCASSDCKNMVDALSMDDEGYCNDCHDKRVDGLIIEESDETRFLSDESLRIMCEHPIRVRSSRSSVGNRKNRYR
jgi:hypothetical protein